MSHKCPYYNDKCPKCMTPTPDTSSVEELRDRVKWALADDLSGIAGLSKRTVPKSGLSKVRFDLQTQRVMALIHSEVTAFAEGMMAKLEHPEFCEERDIKFRPCARCLIDHHLTRYKEGK